MKKMQRRTSNVQRRTSNVQRGKKTSFANSLYSDQGPTNPKLGNVKPSKRPAPTGMTPVKGGAPQEQDFFRQERMPSSRMPMEPDVTVTPERVALSVRMRYNPIKGLTFERLVAALDAWDLGFFRNAAVLWDKMEKRDYQLKVVAPKRKKSVARNGYDILIVDECPEDQKALAAEQQTFLKNFYGNVTATSAMDPDETGGMSLLVRQMADAIGKKYANHEIVWQPTADGNLTAKFIFCPLWWFEGTRGKLRFLESEFQVYGKEMLPGEWLVTVHDGLMEACCIIKLFRDLPIKSWISYLDKFGMPGIQGKTDAQKGSKEWEELKSAIRDFSEEWTAVTGTGAEISLVEAKAAGGGAESGYAVLVEKMDRAMTQLWRGSDLGTQSSQNANGASLQDDETEILEEDDGTIFSETLTSQVSRYALAWKFGPDAPQLAYIKLRTRDRKNVTNELAVDQFMITNRVPVGVNQLLERYDRAKPAEDDDLVEGPAVLDQSGPSDPKNPQDKSEMANDASSPKSKRLLIDAILSEYQHVNERLLKISDITDGEVQKQKLAEVLSELDAIQKQIDADPAVAQVIYKILAANVANGIAAGTSGSQNAKTQKSKDA